MTGRKHTPAHRQAAVRKERKLVYRMAAGTAPATIPGSSIPLVVPGTNTRHEQLRQSRRWLGNERRTNPPRFSLPAIQQVERLFHKDNNVRTNNPTEAMSDEAKQIVTIIETERAAALAIDNSTDWWEGESRKGVTGDERKAFKAARNLQQAAEEGHEDRLGLASQEQETEDAALGAMTFEDMGLGSKTFDDIGYVSCDDELADEEVAGEGGQMAGERGGEGGEMVVEGGEMAVHGEGMEGLEQGDATKMDMDMDLD
ncbi:MAG: hypothetical protein LQ339_000392 [Xanthoria mediterranea]|nr:MAG: hypothetical protein LQ339_000392 [Xanthoria mediterranea]